MIQVVPAIIPESLDDLHRKVAMVAPYVSSVQIDIMDGNYASSISWPFEGNKHVELSAIKSMEELLGIDGVDYNLDMMVREPEQYVNEWIEAGVHSPIIHFESTDNLEEIIKKLRVQNIGIGLALRPSTPNDAIEPFISRVNFVQCMGNDKIGYHEVPLDVSVLGKITDKFDWCRLGLCKNVCYN